MCLPADTFNDEVAVMDGLGRCSTVQGWLMIMMMAYVIDVSKGKSKQ